MYDYLLGSELIQNSVPGARVVKAFTIYGYENFEDSNYVGGKPSLLYCGNDTAAKQVVSKIVEDVGFEPVDCGGLDSALHLEHITLLWIKMVRVQKHPMFTFSILKRPN